MSKVVKHPQALRLFREASERFLRLRKARDVTRDAMWVGLLATNFSDLELRLLRDYLSPYDLDQLMKVGRKIRFEVGEVPREQETG